ncbi:MAG TPA: hypothetical protein VK563_07365 [Puia sp.]|nr:hypothetical protein [Puia sp.]
MNSLSLPVVHPSFERLKRSGIWLHITAGLIILTHAFSHLHQQESNAVYFWCQLLIAVDIFVLVFAGGNVLSALPKVNLFFRLIEILFFLGIGLTMLLAGKLVPAIVHIGLSLIYSYLFYCERGLRSEEILAFHHTGITLPGLPERRFLYWTHINKVEAHYDSILIHTSLDEDIRLNLRKNLDFAELEQIHEFCRYYLGVA